MNNIKKFEKNISNTITTFCLVALLITSILFIIIYFQSNLQRKIKKSKIIDGTINLFEARLSEKLAIIANSNIFIDFLESGIVSRKILQPQFQTEMLPLRANGIVGYSLTNSETKLTFNSGVQTNQFVKFRLCYLANKLDSEYGNCYGFLKLYFSIQNILDMLIKMNNSIIPCKNCVKYSFSKNGYFGSFPIEEQSEFGIKISLIDYNQEIIFYYLFIAIILIGFTLLNKIKLNKIIKKTISEPLDALMGNIKNQKPIVLSNDALSEINYLYEQIEVGRVYHKKASEAEKQIALGELAASVAHDIRSPLAVLQIIISEISSSILPSQLSFLNEALQRVRDIANDLLIHYRQSSIANDSSETNEKNISNPILLLPLIHSIVEQKILEWKNNPCKLSLNHSNNASSFYVFACVNQIKRILSNLLNNAYESLSTNGEILVSLSSQNNTVLLEIHDNGCGISNSRIDEVLKGSSSKHEGKGLGLTNAIRYIQDIGGSLKLDSIEFHGTKVSIELPLPNSS